MSLFRSIQHLLPTGESFRLGISKYVTKFWQGLGAFADTVKTYIDLVYLDLFPSSTRELEEWEKFYGLSPTADAEESARRMALAAEWQSTGGQSPSYIQGVLQAAGFGVYIHEWWASSDPWVARDPHDYTETPIYGTFQASDDDEILCGDLEAQCNNWLANDPRYWANLTLSPLAPPVIPYDPTLYPYFLYFGGASFPVPAIIETSRKAELKRLIQKLKPSQNWIVLIAEYTSDQLLTEDDDSILTEDDDLIYA